MFLVGSALVSGREAQHSPLVGPGVRQTDAFQAGRGQFDRVAAIKNGLDDFEREECERQDTADVCLMDTVAAGEFCDRFRGVR